MKKQSINALFGKLGFKLVGPYLAMSLFTLCIILILAAYNFYIHVTMLKKIQDELASRASFEVEAYIHDIITSMEMSSDIIRDDMLSSEHMHAVLKILFDRNPSIYSAVVIDESGKEKKKMVRFNVNAGDELQNMSQEESFQKGLAGVYLGHVYISKFNLPFMQVSVPIRTRQGRVQGVLVTTVDLSPMWGTIAKIRVKKSGYVYIVDQSGYLIAYKDVGLVKQHLNLQSVKGVAHFFNKNRDFTMYESFNKEHVIGNWKTIQITGWGLIIEVPLKDMLHDLWLSMGVMLMAMIGFVIFFFVIFKIVIKKLLLPLQLLQKGVLEVKQGNLNYTIEKKSDDEIGTLADTFNAMINELKEKTKTLEQYGKELEHKVEMRTEQIRVTNQELEDANNKMRLEIKERNLVESALRENEERYRLIYENSSDGIIIINDGRIFDCNQAVLKMFACRKEDILKKTIADLSPLLQSDGVNSSVKASAKIINALSGLPQTFEWTHMRFDETPFDAEIKLNGIMLQGEPCVQAIVSDITVRKQTEEALRHAKEQAEFASSAKSDFLATMSHEIRTPMNAILGFVEILNSTALNAEQKDYLRIVALSGELLLNIINDILDLSKAESGEIQLESIAFNIEYLVEDIFRIIRQRLEGKPIALYYEIEEKVPIYLEGDPTRIRQIIINLLANAIKFTEHGSIGLLIKVISATDTDCLLSFHVKDTGTGIPEDKQTLIFNAFTQADMSTTRQYGGTGLGLSICSAYVHAMNGKISVESAKDSGSTFIFEIPLKKVKNVEEQEILPLLRDELKNKTMYILDDNDVARKLIIAICKNLQIHYVEYSSAQEALCTLNEITDKGALPDMILSDIMMPHVDGYTFAKKIRENSFLDSIKLIAITSDVRIGVAHKVREAGFDGFLPKPITKRELIAIIRTTLGDKRTRDEQIVTCHMAAELLCKGMRILVAEDNPLNRKLIHLLLSGIGCVVELACNGKEAVEKVKEAQYDAILMDVLMPIIDGKEATRLIRSSISETLPILALTAAILPEDEKSCLESGMNDFVTKPVNIEQLRMKLMQWVKR